MLPSRFEYHRAESLDEALSLLATYGEDAKVLAGGQSLIPMMKLRFAYPGHLIDVNRIPGLDGIEERDGALRIGALVRHHALETSDAAPRAVPDDRGERRPRSPTPSSATSAPSAARSRTRIPRAISPRSCSRSARAVVLRSAGGSRELPLREFLVDTFTTQRPTRTRCSPRSWSPQPSPARAGPT
ncbi:MAG: hypothetical protein KatS3mg014_0539 [Actinomycetota bacterium]|nr:MAG: hypothetical protein KatS3mg014_0539 [Actinomycetota bacterium]